MSKKRTNPGDGPGSSAPQRGEEQARTPSPAHPIEADELMKQEIENPSKREEHGASEALMESFNG